MNMKKINKLDKVYYIKKYYPVSGKIKTADGLRRAYIELFWLYNNGAGDCEKSIWLKREIRFYSKNISIKEFNDCSELLKQMRDEIMKG